MRERKYQARDLALREVESASVTVSAESDDRSPQPGLCVWSSRVLSPRASRRSGRQGLVMSVFLLLLALCCPAMAARLQVQVEDDDVVLGQTVTLEVPGVQAPGDSPGRSFSTFSSARTCVQ